MITVQVTPKQQKEAVIVAQRASSSDVTADLQAQMADRKPFRGGRRLAGGHAAASGFDQATEEWMVFSPV
jgi:hypothetical protein